MKIIRYKTSPVFSPGASYPTLRDEMDRLFDVAFPALNSLQRGGLFGEFPVDLYQDKDAYTVRAELPGFHREGISVDVADGVLTLSATRKSEAKPEDKAAEDCRVSRAIALPDDLDLDNIRANYENGILTVTLPKREEVKPKQIAVEVK